MFPFQEEKEEILEYVPYFNAYKIAAGLVRNPD